jgi:peptidoglycan/LPS O-acetylase OafA/YrhL
MPVPDERSEAERSRQSRVSAEREVGLPVPIEGVIGDGPPPFRRAQGSARTPARSFPEAASLPPHRHHHSTTGQRIAFVTGLAFAALLPAVLAHPEAPKVDDAAFALLLMGMATLKTVGTVIVALAVMWRLRRHMSMVRRAGYLVAPWLMALGVGLIASATLPFYGALAFDVGLVLLLILAASDERLRRGRSR